MSTVRKNGKNSRMQLKILLEDEFLCVVDKPAGVVVNNADSVKDETVQQWFEQRVGSFSGESEFVQKGGIVHRLDRDTSGVLLLAKTETAYEHVKLQFLERKTKKEYVAMVHGVPKEAHQILSLPIERFSKNKHKFAVGTDPSRMAITEYFLQDTYTYNKEPYSFLLLKPLTGRTHQLRVHLQHIGNPIVSDPIYGWKKWLKEDVVWCPRLFLHAMQLVFVHPSTGVEMMVKAELAEDLAKARGFLLHSMT